MVEANDESNRPPGSEDAPKPPPAPPPRPDPQLITYIERRDGAPTSTPTEGDG